MRKIEHIIIHCSATPEGRHHTLADIDRWHKERGFATVDGITVGYHYVIQLDGTLETGRPHKRAGAHARGRNRNSIGICYIGGLDKNMKPKNTLTAAQKHKLEITVKKLLYDYPQAKVSGHYNWASKDCPCFDVQDWCKSVGIQEKHIT